MLNYVNMWQSLQWITVLALISSVEGANVTVQENEKAELQCSIAGSSHYTWRLNNASGSLIVQYDVITESYKYYGVLSKGQADIDPITGTLTFSSVQLSDENTYYCDRGGSDSVTTKLIVQVIPDQVTLQPEPPNDYVASGSTISSQCVMERAKPAASGLSWSLQGTNIEGQGDMTTEENGDGTFKHTRRLDLTLTPDHHGKILSCRGQVGDKWITSKAATLLVGYGPNGTGLNVFPSSLTNKINEEISMKCDASSLTLGKPETHWYAWKKNGSNKIIQNATHPTLSFKAEEGDNGNFTCIMGNTFGRTGESQPASLILIGVAPESPPMAAIIGGAIAGGVLLIIIFFVLIYFVRKRKEKSQSSVPPYRMAKGEDHVRPIGKDASAPNGMGKGQDSPGPRVRPTPTPRQSKMPASSKVNGNAPEPMYSEPDLIQKHDKKKEKGKKDFSPEPEYAEPSAVRGKPPQKGVLPENMYANTDNNNLTPQQQGRYRTPDGQLYTEVAFVNAPTLPTGRRPNIRREEEPTEYARVDFTKKAPPLPDDDY